MVLVGHLNGTRGAPHFSDVHEDVANLGVRTFFIISGFLITTLLLEERAATGTISLRKFYIRRVFRIFPASYAYIAAIALLSVWGIVTLKHNDLLCAITYTVNNHYDRSWWIGHLWSLSVEEQFYLLWPAIMVFLGTAKAFRVALWTIVAAPLFRILIMVSWPAQRPGVGTIFPTIADAIAVGCILACIRGDLTQRPPYMRFLTSRWFLLVPVGVFVLNYRFSTKVSVLLGESLLNIAIALCIDWCVRTPNSLPGRVLNSRVLVWFGVLSYSLYLWQQPFINRTSDHLINAAPLNVILAIAAAILSYYLIEKPFLKLKTRFEAVPNTNRHVHALATSEGSDYAVNVHVDVDVDVDVK
jgi:peptidoglycan/LPS O-acetylase OafA/YrhL